MENQAGQPAQRHGKQPHTAYIKKQNKLAVAAATQSAKHIYAGNCLENCKEGHYVQKLNSYGKSGRSNVVTAYKRLAY